MRLKYCSVVLCLSLSICAGAQYPAKTLPVVHGAKAEVLRVDQTANTVSFQITNISTKDITAYTVALVATYADGKTDRDERLSDFLPALISRQVYGGSTTPGEDLFHPGETRDGQGSFAVTAGNPIRHVDIQLEVVAYADQTVEITNEEAFGRLMDVRKGSILAKQKSIQAMKKALADPANPHPAADALNDVEQLHSAAAKHRTDDLSVEYLWVIQELKRQSERSVMHDSPGTQSLRDYLANTEKELSLLAPHAQLRRLP